MDAVMKCRFCDSEAVYDFGATHLLCAECCVLKVLDRAKINSSNSVSDGVAMRSLPSGEIEPSVMLARAPSDSSFPVIASSGETATAVDNPAGLPAAVADHSQETMS